MVHICNLIPHVCMCVCMYLPSQIFLSGGQAGNSNRQQRLNLVLNRQIFTELIVCIMYVHFFFGVELIKVLKKELCDNLVIQDVKIFNNKIKLDHSLEFASAVKIRGRIRGALFIHMYIKKTKTKQNNTIKLSYSSPVKLPKSHKTLMFPFLNSRLFI